MISIRVCFDCKARRSTVSGLAATPIFATGNKAPRFSTQEGTIPKGNPHPQNSGGKLPAEFRLDPCEKPIRGNRHPCGLGAARRISRSWSWWLRQKSSGRANVREGRVGIVSHLFPSVDCASIVWVGRFDAKKNCADLRLWEL